MTLQQTSSAEPAKVLLKGAEALILSRAMSALREAQPLALCGSSRSSLRWACRHHPIADCISAMIRFAAAAGSSARTIGRPTIT